MPRILRGEIYWADLGPIASLPSGELSIEIAKRRPVVVMSHAALNRVSEHQPFYVLIVPGTTGASSFRDRRTNVRLSPAETGLREEGMFLAHQMRSLDVRKLSPNPVGRLTGKAFDRVETAVRYALGLAD